MNRSIVLRRLCWKEYRQLWPLIAMLAVMALTLQSLLLLNRFELRSTTLPIAFFFGLPGLFAAGVGALLVGQEKESRTLYWMASLPIKKQDIIRVKFLAGFLGLGAIWIISFLMLVLTGGLSNDFGPISIWDVDLPIGILYSIFLLVLGFATAWSFRSTFIGLLVLVGIALTYTLATNAFPSSVAINTITLGAASAVALVVGWIYALRALAPTAPPMFSRRAIAGSSYFERSIVDQRTIQTPWSALIWQFAAQNRAMLLGICAMFLISLLICCIATNAANLQGPVFVIDIEKFLPVPCVFIAFIAISWLGVITFQGDNLYQRIRFLSDRGIAPKTVWLTRQIIPVGLLVLATIMLVVAAATMLILSNEIRLVPSMGLLVLVAIGCMWTIYSMTQWMSQVIRSPIIAAILAPVVGILPFAYGSVTLDVLETPFWLLAIVSFIPMIATYRLTLRWMDGRMGKRFWLEHAGWLALAVTIPAIPFLVVYATYPSMPASEWVEFGNEIQKTWNSRRPIEISLLAPNTNSNALGLPLELNGTEGAETVEAGMGDTDIAFNAAVSENKLPVNPTLEEERELQLGFIERQLQGLDPLSPISNSFYVMKRLMGDAMLTRLRMEDDGSSEALRKRYQQNVGIIVRIVRGIRLTPDLKTQQIADQFEAWLVQEVLSDGAEDRLGAEIWSAAMAQLSDKVGRRASRLRALCNDFYLSVRKANSRSATEHTIGGFPIPTVKSGTRLISRRHVSTVVWHMKQLLYASDESARKQARETVARDWDVSTTQFGLSLTPFATNYAFMIPCSLWHGEWEKQADGMK